MVAQLKSIIPLQIELFPIYVNRFLSLTYVTEPDAHTQSTAKPAMPTQAHHYVDSNIDVRSHYSDSAAVVATLYSLSATGGGIGGVGTTNTAGAPPRTPTNAIIAHHRSASITAAGGGAESAPTITNARQPPQSSSYSSSSSQPFHTNSLHRKPEKLSIKSNVPSACATLQRPNGYFRSNQSLCSCNADSEVIHRSKCRVRIISDRLLNSAVQLLAD